MVTEIVNSENIKRLLDKITLSAKAMTYHKGYLTMTMLYHRPGLILAKKV